MGDIDSQAVWWTIGLVIFNAGLTGWEWRDSRVIGGLRRFVSVLSAVIDCIGCSWIVFLAACWCFDSYGSSLDRFLLGCADYIYWMCWGGVIISGSLHINYRALLNADWGGTVDFIRYGAS